MMKYLFILLFLCLSLVSFAQSSYSKDGTGFDSFFQNMKSGEFQGRVSGELCLVKTSGDTMSINLNDDKAFLQIAPDPNDVYDVSRKIYSCVDEGATIRYTTYASANAFEIIMNGVEYGRSLIDGGCDLVIKNLEYVYKQTGKQEHLYLFFTKDVDLALPHTCGIPQVFIQAGSMLCFTIEK